MSKGTKRKLYFEDDNDTGSNQGSERPSNNQVTIVKENRPKKKLKTIGGKTDQNDADFEFIVNLQMSKLRSVEQKLYNKLDTLKNKINQDEKFLTIAQASTYLKNAYILLNNIINLETGTSEVFRDIHNLNTYYNNDLAEIDHHKETRDISYYNEKQNILKNVVEITKQYGAMPNLPHILQMLIDSYEVKLLDSFIEQCKLSKIHNFQELFNLLDNSNHSAFGTSLINFLDAKPKPIDFEILNLLLSNGVLNKNFNLKNLLEVNNATTIDPYALIQLYKFGFDIDEEFFSKSVDSNLIELLSNSKKDIIKLFANDLKDLKYEGMEFFKHNNKLLNNILKAITVRSNLDKQNNWPSADDIKIDEYNLSLKTQALQQIVKSSQDVNELPQELIDLVNVAKVINGVDTGHDNINLDIKMFLFSLIGDNSNSATTFKNLLQPASINEQTDSTEILGLDNAEL